ncbi:GNAT family N-acetyltransferase [Treponema primitia]|uniref:GNAT family N-acetyltransferase n=1 Tax=Treponema primitia TaxID=88058 RepID=UPI0002555735|nr:GNAT family N-acetyltransferase [Treponema primitia]
MDYFTINGNIRLRYAEEKDTALILEFIRGLAEYEHLLDQVEATPEDLKKYIFHEHKAEVIIGEYKGIPAGFALFFHNFSTFLGRPGIYIEDLFVKPELRGKGLGKALFTCLAALAVERNCGRLEWSCLNWNEPSIAFYKAQGGQPLTEWTTFRVTGDKLTDMAGRSGKL